MLNMVMMFTVCGIIGIAALELMSRFIVWYFKNNYKNWNED